MMAGVVKPDEMKGDRGVPSVNEVGSSSSAGRKVGLVLFIAFAVALVFAVMYFTVVRKFMKEEGRKPKEEAVLRSSTGAPPPLELPPEAKADVAVPGRVAAPPPLPVVPEADVDPSVAPMMFSGSGQASARGGDGETGAAVPVPDHGGSLSEMLSGTVTGAGIARMLPDRNFLLTKGNVIECGLQTRLDSTVSGMISCNTTKDVFSSNGRVLLFERGSRIVGEYRGGNMKQGQERLFVVWSRIETPNGVIVDLNSPGVDALGGSGVPGHVDTHFWKRFGNALLLSVVETGLDILKERANRSINGDSFQIGESSGDDASEMATEALRNSINIPPTLYVLNGDRLNVFVARDLDLSAVYGLSLGD